MSKLLFVLLKKSKLFFFVPLFILGVVLPFMCVFFYNHYNKDMQLFMQNIIIQLHLFIPLLSSWWTILILKDFYESDGNELLYLYYRPRHLLVVHCMSVVMYIGMIIVFFFIFQIFTNATIFFMYQLIVESLVVSSLVYFLCMALQNTGTGLLIVLSYCVYINLFDSLRVLTFMSIFPMNGEASSENIRLIEISLMITVVLLGGGYVFSKIRHVYK